MRQFKGSTANAGSAILGAQFWKTGVKITGTFTRNWQSSVGEMYEFMVPQGQPKPTVYLDEKGRVTDKGLGKETQLDKFSIGALKGFQMALVDLENQGITLKFRDQVEIACSGTQDSGDGKDDMVLFELTISR